MNVLEIFLKLNKFVAEQNVVWIQGAGGNSSFKSDNNLYIKASGRRIKEILSINDCAKVLIDPCKNEIKNIIFNFGTESDYKDALEANSLIKNLRPSMETGFHLFCEGQFVFHLHSLISILLADLVSKNIEFLNWYNHHWKKKLGTFIVLDNCMPGLELSASINKNINNQIFLVKNHGVILSFNDEHFLSHYKQFELEAITFLKLPNNLVNYYKKSALELINIFPELLTSKLKFYFPDFVIMKKRIDLFLNTQFELLTFNIKNKNLDLDALENWLAMSILTKAHPDLEELEKDFINKIPLLSTEIERIKLMGEY